MERVVVKNFGPIKYMDINIPRLLVLIGDQATGKSTLSKLIYIFRHVATKMAFRCTPDFYDDFFNIDSIISYIEKSMLLAFDICFIKINSEIEYFYNDNCFIKIEINKAKNNNYQYVITLSPKLKNYIEIFNEYNMKISDIDNDTIKGNVRSKSFLLKHIYKLVAKFCNELNLSHSMVYLGADRTELKSKNFENTFFTFDGKTPKAVVEQFITILEMSKEENFNENIDIYFKKRKKYNDTAYEDIKDPLSEQEIVLNLKELVYEAQKLIGGVVGEKENIGYGLYINEDAIFVPYDYLSSGQRTLLSIVATVCLIGTKGMKMYNPLSAAILEEPEAHIFPTNQFSFIKLIADALELNNNARFIITTHSPYILSSIHALVAYGKLNKCNNILKKNYTLTGLRSSNNDLGMYILKNGKARSLRDKQTGLFNTDEIDEVSDEINEVLEFSILEKLDEISREDF